MKLLKLSKVMRPCGADHRQPAALGRVRIHVVEVLEVGRILEIAEDRKPVALGWRRRGRIPRAITRKVSAMRERGAVERQPLRWLRGGVPVICRVWTSSAFCFSGSIHQTCVSAAVVCDGSVAGGRRCPR